ncbi:hypothetical protein KVR01_003995 [Diaporthe batatas]|uniref:uncharacterized protein n=1 Tax=Diaporthe batatas TaxID=748121 RepID=UPI001D05234E|nr:uncharacterized protein KVR01_003995 [Diaporthe batatas]KAG8168306.1 hypothetical protein KVR01_003995 [Diaporthe batatas]
MASWADFPPEIRLLILEALLQDGCTVAELATVSREWQAIIEQHNFARIKITKTKLPGFFLNTRRSRHLVKYIWLSLDLDVYSCCICNFHNPYNPFLSNSDAGNVLGPILKLLTWLKEWEPTGELVLDISVHSPSDSKHWLKYLTFEPDIIPENGRSPGSTTGSADIHVPEAHDWNVYQRFEEKKAILKTLDIIHIVDHDHEIDGSPCMWRLPEKMPTVPAVTGVLLRQQTRRQWHPRTLQRILECFPNLQDFVYEPWKRIGPERQKTANEEYASLFESLALTKLRKLVIFEASNWYYKRLIRESLSMTLAANSHGLREISASFLIEAASYFSYSTTGREWYHLQSLTLTSDLLSPREHPRQIDQLLTNAAKAARNMPALRTMELWNGRPGLAALFRYQRIYAAVIWRGTWNFTLRPAVVQAWKDIAIKQGARGLVVHTERLDCGPDIKSHGDAIHKLRLSKPVVRPISLHQIRTEHNVHCAWQESRKEQMRLLEVEYEDDDDWDDDDWEDEDTNDEDWDEVDWDDMDWYHEYMDDEDWSHEDMDDEDMDDEDWDDEEREGDESEPEG